MAKSTDKNPFQQIKILTVHKSTSLKNIHFNFIMILQGSIRLRNDKGTIFMDTKDIYMIQPNEECTIISSGNNLVLSIILDSTFFLNGLSTHRGIYHRQQGSRNIDEVDATLEGAGCKTAEVGYHTASEVDHARVT